MLRYVVKKKSRCTGGLLRTALVIPLAILLLVCCQTCYRYDRAGNAALIEELKKATNPVYQGRAEDLPVYTDLSRGWKLIDKVQTKDRRVFLSLVGRTVLLLNGQLPSTLDERARDLRFLSLRDALMKVNDPEVCLMIFWHKTLRVYVSLYCVSGRVWGYDVNVWLHAARLASRQFTTHSGKEDQIWVEAVFRDGASVSVSGGLDMGLIRGMPLGVYRDGHNIAQLVVSGIGAQSSLCSVAKSTEKIRSGDVVKVVSQ